MTLLLWGLQKPDSLLKSLAGLKCSLFPMLPILCALVLVMPNLAKISSSATVSELSLKILAVLMGALFLSTFRRGLTKSKLSTAAKKISDGVTALTGFYSYLESIMPLKRIIISLAVGMIPLFIVLWR